MPCGDGKSSPHLTETRLNQVSGEFKVMAGDCFTASEISDFASKDTSRLVGTIAKALAAKPVYMNVIQVGMFPSGVADEVRTPVQMQAAPGDSLAEPTFVCDTEICGTSGSV